MNRFMLPTIALAIVATPVCAQQTAPNFAVSTSRALWQGLTGYITTTAEELPEDLYAYRPTDEVRSFGEMFAHVAGAQYLICAAALGDPPRDEAEVERTAKTKAAIVAALKASTEYCARAYGQTDAAAGQSTQLFGQDATRLYALTMNATHNGEHYGNIVTYLRLNGIVPPSSRGGM
ncbi:MAG: DinB family protein [Gemmatimonadota bacterium]|nr:DinB family protein [Gemmatimonadota bacterium]MDH5197259.1 DinB family protein [Gemmatimonadota bacterium]